MEESVALDSTNQNDFVKNIKGIKKLLKKGKIDKVPGNKTVNRLAKERKKSTRAVKGLVYLSHIPHGFYEHEMTQYFKQFGGVTNVRVIRSKHTGKSKGYAFIEFADPAVAQIVADTMNNYLMGKRLLKAKYIPPEEQKVAFRKNWNSQNNPKMNHKRIVIKKYNEDKPEEEQLQFAKKMLNRINKNKRKLKEMGIDYSFFQAVDVPDELKGLIETQEEIENQENEHKTKVKSLRKRKIDAQSEDSVVEEQPKVMKKSKVSVNEKPKVLKESKHNDVKEHTKITKKPKDEKKDKVKVHAKKVSEASVNSDLAERERKLIKKSKDKVAKKLAKGLNDFEVVVEEPKVAKKSKEVAKIQAKILSEFEVEELDEQPKVVKKPKAAAKTKKQLTVRFHPDVLNKNKMTLSKFQ